MQGALPRSKRLKASLNGSVMTGATSGTGSGGGSGGDGHNHANKTLLDSLMSSEDGYLYLVGKTEDSDDSIAAKVLAGGADKWDGHAFDEWMDQPVRTVDEVCFTAVSGVNKITFANGATLEVDGDVLKFSSGIYSLGEVTAYGKGTSESGSGGDGGDGGGGGGSNYYLLTSWPDYTSDMADTYAISAGLGFALESQAHTHSNKSVLDGITSSKVSSWDTAASKSAQAHTHSNKSVLDGITSTQVATWDAQVAKRLSTARWFALSGGVAAVSKTFDGTANCVLEVIKLDESYLEYGTKSGYYTTPNDLIMRRAGGGANVLAFINTDAVSIEYSRDGGSSWTEYVDVTVGTAQEQAAAKKNYDRIKRMLTTNVGCNNNLEGWANLFLGKAETSSAKQSSQYQLRVTVDFHKTGIYSSYIKSYINFSIGGASNNTVTVAWLPDGGTAWTAIATDVVVNGWTGWNVINGFNRLLNHKSTAAADSSQARYIRWTFKTSGLPSSSQYAGASVGNIFLISDVNYSWDNQMANAGLLYNSDCYQNMLLPASLKFEVSQSEWSREICICGDDNWQSSLAGLYFSGSYNAVSKVSLLNNSLGLNVDRAGNITMTDGVTTVKKIAFPNGCYIEQSGSGLKVHGYIFSDNNVAVQN